MSALIGLAGTKGSGKDTAAAALAGFENVKMAGALKLMLRALLAYQGVDQETIDRMIDGDLKEVPTAFLGGRSPRYAMVTLGTEWGRDLMASDLWIGIAERRIGLFDHVVVSDVRFPNEVAMVKRLGGEVFRVERTGSGAADPHPSESQIATLNVDGVLANIFSSAEAFQDYVRSALLRL